MNSNIIFDIESGSSYYFMKGMKLLLGIKNNLFNQYVRIRFRDN